jgi:hypothetical protein
MNRMLRWGRWTVIAAGVLLLFWVAATVGAWSPDLRRLTTSVHGPLVADYRADSPQALAPLSPDITRDASRDQASRPTRSPRPTPTGTTPTPTASGPLPTLPVPTPSVPVVSPTLPTPLPTPTLPTPPPLP